VLFLETYGRGWLGKMVRVSTSCRQLAGDHPPAATAFPRAVGLKSGGRYVTMADSGNKTTATGGDVGAFIDGISDDQRRRDATLLIDTLREVTGEPPVLWGTSIVGFGSRHYRYDSGREGDTPAIGFSPRAAQTTLYLSGALEEYTSLLERLGQHKLGKGCLYLKRVDQADAGALREILALSYRIGTTT
jgi:hypothetical protein